MFFEIIISLIVTSSSSAPVSSPELYLSRNESPTYQYGRSVIVWGEGRSAVIDFLGSRKMKFKHDYVRKQDKLALTSSAGPAVGTQVLRFTLRGDAASNAIHSSEKPVCSRIADLLKAKGLRGGCMMQ